MDLGPETLTLDAEDPASDRDGVGSNGVIGEILAEAERRAASHVHLETAQDTLTVRLRVAGRLTAPLHLGGDARAAIARADLRNLRHRGNAVGAATMPAHGGERIVLHLRGQGGGAGALEALGMRPALSGALETLLSRPEGLVLVAGPPGSGTTTTLHALLGRIDSGTRSLLTVEARIEGEIAGAGRLAAPEQGLTMAEGLRAVLRQDPDVVMIGNIADRETATAAVQAAQAGHLVLAGVPATSAVGAIRWMRDLRVEPFQLASTLRIAMAQRLVKKLCRACRVPVQAQGSVSSLLGFDSGVVVYSPDGCDQCSGTGFSGQTGVFEAILADGPLRRLINDGGDEAILARHAFLNAPNLGSAARALVREGVTTPDEAVRVSRS